MLAPKLDTMAAQGMIFRQHYSSSPVCAPARASLLFGQRQDNCPIHDSQFDKALLSNHTLTTVLKQAGYYCGVSYRGYVRTPADSQYTFCLAGDSGIQPWPLEIYLGKPPTPR